MDARSGVQMENKLNIKIVTLVSQQLHAKITMKVLCLLSHSCQALSKVNVDKEMEIAMGKGKDKVMDSIMIMLNAMDRGNSSLLNTTISSLNKTKDTNNILLKTNLNKMDSHAMETNKMDNIKTNPNSHNRTPNTILQGMIMDANHNTSSPRTKTINTTGSRVSRTANLDTKIKTTSTKDSLNTNLRVSLNNSAKTHKDLKEATLMISMEIHKERMIRITSSHASNTATPKTSINNTINRISRTNLISNVTNNHSKTQMVLTPSTMITPTVTQLNATSPIERLQFTFIRIVTDLNQCPNFYSRIPIMNITLKIY